MLTSGQLLAQRYRVNRLLAHGGMADVYLAMDEHIQGLVALKLLHPHFAADPVFVQRFRTEAKTAGQLVHPNIVRCLDFGIADDQPFLVMEYVAGESLADRLAQAEALPPEQVLALVRPVLAALAYVHEQGLVHRDVKPANVLLAQDGTVKLTDFGIAQAVAAATLTRPGEVLGSVHYLAPERLRGARATPASDCYAVGVLLYRLLTGRLPFAGDDVAGVIAQQLHHRPPPPSVVRPEVPAWLDRVVLHALAKEPAQRYPSATRLLAALSGEPTAPLSATALHGVIHAADQPPSVARTQPLPHQAARRSAPHGPSQERPPAAGRTTPPTRRRSLLPVWGWCVAVVGMLASVLLYLGSQLGPVGPAMTAQSSNPTPTSAPASAATPSVGPSMSMPAPTASVRVPPTALPPLQVQERDRAREKEREQEQARDQARGNRGRGADRGQGNGRGR